MAPPPFLPAALAAAAALAACAGSPNAPAAARSEAAPADPNAGLWLGPVQLCRGTVESASAIADVGGSPALVVTLVPEARLAFARWTKARVGRPMAIRLDGRTPSEPVILEPIIGGRAQISAPPGDVEAAARAASEPC
jgi:preprotein translocase subunit SecD